jgi:hypothetical protein
MTNPYHDAPVHVIARQAAKTFGGTQVSCNRDGEYFAHWALVNVEATDTMPAYQLSLTMRGYGTKSGELTVTLCPLHQERDLNGRDGFARASMNSGRELQSLMADISRRLVNAPGTAEMLRDYARRVQELKDRKRGLDANLAELLTCPNARTNPDQPASNYGAEFYNASGTPFSARLSTDGTVRFDRISTVTLERAKRILAILAEGA